MHTIEGLLDLYFDRELIEYTCEKCQGTMDYDFISLIFLHWSNIFISYLARGLFKMYDVKRCQSESKVSSLAFAIIP